MLPHFGNGKTMSQIAFYWGPLNAVHNITMALWIGSIFFYIFGLQSCLSLLDPTQRNSVQLQSLNKLFQFNWLNAIIVILTQAAILFLSDGYNIKHPSAIIAMGIVIIMIILQFIVFTNSYRKARRALRPKPEIFRKINTPLKLIVFLGIIDLALLAF